MVGKKLSAFMEALYHNPEIELEYMSIRYMISGYIEKDMYVLRVDTIDPNAETIFISRSTQRQVCVEAFETAHMFAGKTIYEAEKDIVVLYG